MDDSLLRHIRACRNAAPPYGRLPFLIGADQVGWVLAALSSVLERHPAIRTDDGRVVLKDAQALPELARLAAEAGHGRWRGEAFDVRAEPDGSVLARIDRGALPAFGIAAEGVHVNGIVNRPEGAHLWVARRAADKKLDPGKLDHVVAGGVAAGMTPAETLLKEAAEEAAMPETLSKTADHVGIVSYVMRRDEGLRRDRLHCYDITLPDSFVPRPADGEVEAFELWPLPQVLETVRRTDDFKFNVSLVLIDLFIRRGLVPAEESAAIQALS
jgi:thiamine pyrophosphokinase